MEIIVEGIGRGLYKPDEIILNLKFYYKSNIYAKVFEEGKKQVLDFFDKILFMYGFNKNDMKTINLVVKEEKKYNEETRTYDFDGYSFTQESILKFDYEEEKLFSIMMSISNLDNPVYYTIDFSIKDEKRIKDELISKAYKDALEKAMVIASASGKTLKSCIKVSFKPFDIDFLSLSSLNSNTPSLREGSAYPLDNMFIPEDIDVSTNIYCLWVAE